MLLFLTDSGRRYLLRSTSLSYELGDMLMRKILLATSAGVIGLLISLAPASALTSYQINTDGSSNFTDPDDSSSVGGITMTSKTTDSNGLAFDNGPNNFSSTPSTQQDDLSRNMSWQGTGYYLRPNR